MNVPFSSSLFILAIFFSLLHFSSAGLLSEPVNTSPNTVPAFPLQPETQTCRLDLSAELFGGVKEACSHNLDRSRCCPVLAAWLYAAHARSALQVPASAPVSSLSSELPMRPDDSQKCVNSLQTSLLSRNIKIIQPNSSCDTVMCFCGIRLHQITSLSCAAAFNVTGGHRNATPTAAVKNLEKNCRNSTYSGCTKCLGALQKIKGGDGHKRTTKQEEEDEDDNRATKMFNKDCQLMGLTWLLERNKTAYIPTVSAVLRALMYSAHPPHKSTCSPDQENMPLAVDSLQLENSHSSFSCTSFNLAVLMLLPILPFAIFGFF